MKSPLSNLLGFWVQQGSEGQAGHPESDAAQLLSSFTLTAQKIPTWWATSFFLAMSMLHTDLQHTFTLCLPQSPFKTF